MSMIMSNACPNGAIRSRSRRPQRYRRGSVRPSLALLVNGSLVSGLSTPRFLSVCLRQVDCVRYLAGELWGWCGLELLHEPHPVDRAPALDHVAVGNPDDVDDVDAHLLAGGRNTPELPAGVP